MTQSIGQFRLLAKRRLGPLAASRLLGAVNTNLCRAVLVGTLFGSGVMEAGLGSSLLLLLLLVAPFCVLPPLAGALGDALDKARLIRVAKLGGIGIAALAALAFLVPSAPVLFVALVLVGVLAAFLSPLEYALLPQHLSAREVNAGNGMVHAATFVGLLLGGVLGLVGGGAPALAVVPLVLAAAAYSASRVVPSAPAVRTQSTTERWSPLRETLAAFALVRQNRPVAQSMLGVAWFWLLVALYPVLLTFAPDGLAARAVLWLIAVLLGGAAIGALLCDGLSRRRVELGLVPIGAVGVSLVGVHVAFAIAALVGDSGGAQTEFALDSWLLFEFGLLGAFASLFAVPLQANIQVRAEAAWRARVMAASHVLAALFVGGGVLLALGLFTLGSNLPTLLLALAAVNLGVAAYIVRQVPEFAMRFVVWAVSHIFYRIRREGLAAIPASGPAVLVCNHVSYVDALLLAGAVHRPIRFVIYKPIYDIPVLNFVFRTGRTIPIAAEREDPRALGAAYAAIRAGLADGDLLCIFPEGRLTEDGQLGVFRKGIERIVADSPVPVVPMALRGLWGSFFSRHGKGPFHRLKGRIWSRVTIVAGAPVAPEDATAETLRQRVLALLEER